MDRPVKQVAQGLAALSVFVAFALFITGASTKLVILCVGGFVLMASAFLYAEVALYGLVFSMLLSPQIVVGETAAREITLRLDDFLILLISLGWLARVAIHKELNIFLRTPLNIPIGIYILACIISTSVGVVSGFVKPLSGMFFLLKYVEYFFVYFIAVHYIKDVTQAKRFVAALLVVCIATSVYTMAQIPQGGRLSAPFEKYSEPNTLGGYLVLMLSLALGLLMTLKGRTERLFMLFTSTVIAVPLVYTLSRASWLASGLMAVGLFAYGNKKLVMVSIGVVAIVVSPFLLPGVVKDRISSTFQSEKGFRNTESIGGVSFDPSTSERIGGFKKSLKLWSARPVLGRGITGGGFIDGQYFRTLVELGIAGFAALMFLLFSIMKLLVHIYRSEQDPYGRGMALGAIAGLLALMGHAAGSNTFIIVRIMEPFWFMVGIIVAYSGITSKRYGPVQPT